MTLPAWASDFHDALRDVPVYLWHQGLLASDLTPLQKVLGSVLFAHARPEDPRAWPSLKKLADRANTDKANASRGVKELERRRFVEREHGEKRSTVYHLTLPPTIRWKRGQDAAPADWPRPNIAGDSR